MLSHHLHTDITMIVWYITDCSSLSSNDSSGQYDVDIGGQSVPVYCDMDTDGGQWLVSENRLYNLGPLV